uniref:Putative myosin light chain kinase smooth muscle-like protein n=1 Tax=Rhipicephalus microplus TaxID=6941 RepID=A0A6M2DB71_RHIMP
MMPCPRLICLLVINVVDYAENLMLLSEDVETNPGPDVTQFAKQLQRIADYLKEERLTAIGSKLANISALDSKIANCETRVCALEEVV